MPLSPGDQLGPYEIAEMLGSGGMGEVYRARDTRLHRIVAIKVVRPELARRDEYSARFHREARAISALNHPHVCALYDIGQQNGLDYLVMEFVTGESLAQALKRGPLPIEQALRFAAEIADALQAAHAHGIIHRDLKPGNIMLADAGVKVLDFGLAKQLEPDSSGDGTTVTMAAESGMGGMVGTVAYMSPEQAEGRMLDARSDIFSFGVVLYEMLCGRRPFHGESTLSTLASVLREDPPSPRSLQPSVPPELERIILRCLAKKPEDRYESAAAILRDLEAQRKPVASGIVLKRPLVAAAAAVLLIAALAFGAQWYRQSAKARWAERVAIPQAAELREKGQPLAALKLLSEAESYVPNSTALILLKEDLTPLSFSIDSDPPGAEIYVTDYADPKADDLAHWTPLGRTPLKAALLPRNSLYRFRAVKDGYEPVETSLDFSATIQLRPKSDTPEGMAWVPEGPPFPLVLLGVPVPPVAIPPAWLDKHEVSNREYKKFVDDGGYQKEKYWKQPFLKDGKKIPREQAMAEFLDATRRPGPSTWEGTFPDGKADFPVSGVSWYEAAAYAEYAGKSLPTIYHWYLAAGIGVSSQIISQSNFSHEGLTPRGARLGVGTFGHYDMAGNVKEWTWNSAATSGKEKRFLLGGAWNDAPYMFQQGDSRSPWDRDETFGFRCASYVAPLSEALKAPVVRNSMNRSGDRPVDDKTFGTYQSYLKYDRTDDLKSKVDSRKDAPHWHREDITFQAAYGNERMTLYLFLPKNAAPPYQTILYFPGANMRFARTPEEVATRLMEYIIKSGRAIALPAYSGTLRGPANSPATPSRERDFSIENIKDVSRTIDYLQTRTDIDSARIGFYGLSLGTATALRAIPVEPRLKVAVLLSAGLTRPTSYGEVDVWNYAPRVKGPVLMLNGAEDSMSPVQSTQLPLFKALGTPEKDKKHVVYPGGHVDFIDRTVVINEALAWLERYLGPVKVQP